MNPWYCLLVNQTAAQLDPQCALALVPESFRPRQLPGPAEQLQRALKIDPAVEPWLRQWYIWQLLSILHTSPAAAEHARWGGHCTYWPRRQPLPWRRYRWPIDVRPQLPAEWLWYQQTPTANGLHYAFRLASDGSGQYQLFDASEQLLGSVTAPATVWLGDTGRGIYLAGAAPAQSWDIRVFQQPPPLDWTTPLLAEATEALFNRLAEDRWPVQHWYDWWRYGHTWVVRTAAMLLAYLACALEAEPQGD